MTKRKMTEVFKTVGLPEFTYVKPRHYGEVRADIETKGKNVLIEGPSGIGKTCVVYAIFAEMGWIEGREYIVVSGRDPQAGDFILDYINSGLEGKPQYEVVVADDFHILDEDLRREIGSQLKRLSDAVFSYEATGKVVLIGIPAAGGTVLADAGDLGPRLGSYRFRTADDSEIEKLIDEGEAELNVMFDNRDAILSESSGNFWLAQYVCSKICATNDIFETRDKIQILEFDVSDIRQRLLLELGNRFMPAAVSFAKGKKWRPGGNKPYLEVILALSRIPEMTVPFDSVLSVVPERRRPGLKAVKQRIKEVIFDPVRGIDLRKQIAFEGEYFSIEDPLFRYFLTNLVDEALYAELGVKKDAVETDNSYAYEVGFSFAGETRKIVEYVNSELKQNDSVTFYDYDQQAFLLAEDLEQALGKIYAESCRFYLVFLDENYTQKVWTRFERDIMTRASRSRHIIPVVLDKSVHGKVVGISSTLGMVDISAEWERVSRGEAIEDDLAASIRKKLIDPVVEKASGSSTVSV